MCFNEGKRQRLAARVLVDSVVLVMRLESQYTRSRRQGQKKTLAAVGEDVFQNSVNQLKCAKSKEDVDGVTPVGGNTEDSEIDPSP